MDAVRQLRRALSDVGHVPVRQLRRGWSDLSDAANSSAAAGAVGWDAVSASSQGYAESTVEANEDVVSFADCIDHPRPVGRPPGLFGSAFLRRSFREHEQEDLQQQESRIWTPADAAANARAARAIIHHRSR